MPNVIPSAELAMSLERLNLVVWEAKRQNKSSPTSVTLAGPDLEHMLYGFGDTIEIAVDQALRSPHYIEQRQDLQGAIARLNRALNDLRWAIVVDIDPDWLDHDVPF